MHSNFNPLINQKGRGKKIEIETMKNLINLKDTKQTTIMTTVATSTKEQCKTQHNILYQKQEQFKEMKTINTFATTVTEKNTSRITLFDKQKLNNITNKILFTKLNLLKTLVQNKESSPKMFR
jgi:hypothetical protein